LLKTTLTALLCTITTTAHAQMVDAAQIRPILTMTKANWVGVREWEGRDLIYFTHLESWRCGLNTVTYTINNLEPKTWELAPCDEAAPMAIPDGHLIYTDFPLNSIETLRIDITYDDDTTDSAIYDRTAIQIQ
jgi:hypothetical protein